MNREREQICLDCEAINVDADALPCKVCGGTTEPLETQETWKSCPECYEMENKDQ